MSEQTDVAISDRKAITVTVAERYGMEPDAFEVALRNTVFLEGSRAEYAAFLVVCNEYKLNPLTKEIYAFKNKQTQKIVPVVSVDGWVTLCNTHPAFDGMTFEDQHGEDGSLFAITCTIYRKDRSHPTVVTEYLSECIRDTAPWKMKHRMLRHKALQQGARYAFGFSGIYDEDDAERVEVTVLANEPADFATAPKPLRRPKKPVGGAAADDTGGADESHHARQEPHGEAETAEDAEFEDAGDEDRPTSEVADTATDGAPTAETAQDSPGSAEPAPEASQEQTASSQPEASERTELGSRAPRDTVYRLTTDEPGDDGRLPTYKNGAGFSRVKVDAKVMPPEYDVHAPTEAPAESEAQEEEPEFDDSAPDIVSLAIGKIRSAETFAAGEEAMKELAASPGFKENITDERKRGVRLALWTRYLELVEEGQEGTEPHEDFTLMRLFLEFGAKDEAEIDQQWTPFWRSTFRSVNEGNQRAITDLQVRRKAEMRAARETS